jgi:hypothetical protein
VSEAVAIGSVDMMAAPWSGVTLADLFASTVQLASQAQAFAEAPTAKDPGGRSLTFAAAAAMIEGIVASIEELGLEPGSPILVAMPPVIEAPLAILSVLQAGHIPCLVPVTLEQDDLRDAMATSMATAAITAASIGTLRPADRVRSAASGLDGPRFVLGFGEGLPAGVIPLDNSMAFGRTSWVRALPSFATTTPKPILTLGGRPHDREWMRQDQEGLVASALQLVLRASMASGEPILSTLAPCTAASLATGLVPALLTGGALHLSGLFSAGRFLDQLASVPRPHLVAPAALETALSEAGITGSDRVASTLLLHRPPARLDIRDAPRDTRSPVIDGLALGERGLIVARRGASGRPALTLGETRVPAEPDGALVLAARPGRLMQVEVAGAAVGIGVGETPRDGDTDWYDTGIALRCDDDGGICAAFMHGMA